MPLDTEFTLTHLPLSSPKPEDKYRSFKAKKSPQGTSNYPSRPDVRLHGRTLIQQVERVKKEFEATAFDLKKWKSELAVFGLVIEVYGQAQHDLAMAALETPSSGVKLLRSRIDQAADGSEVQLAIVFIEYGKIRNFLKKIEEYSEDELTKKGNHQNEPLVAGMETIRLATLHALLSILQELRRPKDHAGFFMREKPNEQRNWVQNFIERVTPPNLSAPAVCLIDSGVNNGHPLLNEALSDDDCDAYERDRFGVNDLDGHGTRMAGLALYGDLTPLLPSPFPLTLEHRLESIKMIPRSGKVHEKIHYAFVTLECLARPETWKSGDRPRVYCLTITSNDDLDRGRPSAWSAALDAAILNEAQNQQDAPRLVCVSAGNIDRQKITGSLSINDSEFCHDPAQSWNSITVGAYTERDIPDPEDFPGWAPLAQPGTLCPSSTTDVNWDNNWPIKPDIVMEGGNYITHPEHPGQADTPDCLQLLTTHHRLNERMFATIGDTSAAAALAARFCAIIQADNPRRWPETIRALLIHSAEWTPQMTNWKNPGIKPKNLNKSNALRLLQRYGYGVPNLQRALRSAKSAVTLIAEETFQPFDTNKKIHGYHRYRLPIPAEELQKYGEKNARMRVTLSYYIDPNPTNPEVKSKFRYQGAGLRFDVKGIGESDRQFFSRINQNEALPPDEPKAGSDNGNWLIGSDNCSRGSLHSDTWYGTAAELANKDCIAVHPVGGWWKLRPFLGKATNSLRFSLLVSIEIEEQSVDIYKLIKNQVTITT